MGAHGSLWPNIGIIGTAILAGTDLEEHVISDHVMRIKPRQDALVKPGYLVTALSHPLFGRPMIKSLA
jgi:MFS-type transporter involved in bile tolerance (Atg22 family)